MPHESFDLADLRLHFVVARRVLGGGRRRRDQQRPDPDGEGEKRGADGRDLGGEPSEGNFDIPEEK